MSRILFLNLESVCVGGVNKVSCLAMMASTVFAAMFSPVGLLFALFFLIMALVSAGFEQKILEQISLEERWVGHTKCEHIGDIFQSAFGSYEVSIIGSGEQAQLDFVVSHRFVPRADEKIAPILSIAADGLSPHVCFTYRNLRWWGTLSQNGLYLLHMQLPLIALQKYSMKKIKIIAKEFVGQVFENPWYFES